MPKAIAISDAGFKHASFDEVRKWYDEKLNPDALDLDDQSVYESVYHEGKWGAIFQFTERGAQKFVQRSKPRSINDIAALTSIYRPGPLAAKVDELYNDAKSDPGSIDYGHPLLKECLEKTCGYVIFQEQLMNIGNKIGKLSLDDCDLLRRCITKRSMSGKSKAREQAAELEERFVIGAIENGFTEDAARQLFRKLEFFSGYGFNKSHAIAYAIDSYQCAWLMRYHEPEWLCAYMETQSKDPKGRARALSELRSIGYSVRRIDANIATDAWMIVDDHAFMPSLRVVKYMGAPAIDELIAKRPYDTARSLLWDADGKRVFLKLNKRALDSLIRIEAFRSPSIVGPNGTFVSFKHMHSVIVGESNALKRADGAHEFDGIVSRHRDCGEWTRDERIKNHIDVLNHVPIDVVVSDALLDTLSAMNIVSIDSLTRDNSNERSSDIVWFVIESNALRTSKNGKRYALINAYAESGVMHRLFVWGVTDSLLETVKQGNVCAAHVTLNDFGMSTNAWKIRNIN